MQSPLESTLVTIATCSFTCERVGGREFGGIDEIQASNFGRISKGEWKISSLTAFDLLL
jgi:hypothetical protein